MAIFVRVKNTKTGEVTRHYSIDAREKMRLAPELYMPADSDSGEALAKQPQEITAADVLTGASLDPTAPVKDEPAKDEPQRAGKPGSKGKE